MTVMVTDDGHLQLTTGAGAITPPLSITDVQVLSASIPDAQAAADRAELTSVVRAMIGLLASQPVLNVSQLTVVDGQLTVHLNREAFDALAALWGITPTVPGCMVNGPATAYADPPLSA
jgi:hypothetical protein